MGIAISNTQMVKVPWYQFYKGIGAGFKEAYFWGKVIGGGVAKMIGGLASGQVPNDVSGPIGMYEATSSINKSQGILAVIHFFGIVSVNLAVVNVLPFPALDGGHLMFLVYEGIFRREIPARVKIVLQQAGFALLLVFMAFVLYNDIANF